MSSPLTVADSTDTDQIDELAQGHEAGGLFNGGNWQHILPAIPRDCSPVPHTSDPRLYSSTHFSAIRRPSRAANRPLATDTETRHDSTPTRQRTASYPHSLPFDIPIPNQWGDDTVDDDQLSLAPQQESVTLDDNDENFLSAFADNEFSSPSSYPPLTDLPAFQASPPHQAANQPHDAVASYPGPTAPLRRTSACNRAFATPSRSTTQLTSSSVEDSQTTLFTNEELGDEPTTQSSHSSFSETMPPPALQHLLNRPDRSPTSKRQKASKSIINQGSENKSASTLEPLALPSVPDDDLFGDSLVSQDGAADTSEDMTTIDLTEANEVPEDLRKPDVDNRIKISKFQCVICMDDATTLTVTHCGKSMCLFEH